MRDDDDDEMLINLGCSEKEDLEDVAATKLQNLSVEFNELNWTEPMVPTSPITLPFDPVKRLVDGFKHFKTSYFE